MSDWREYGIEYPWRDGKYVLRLHAESPEDAMARIRQAANLGHCYTPYGIEMSIPAGTGAGLFVRAYVWLRNAWSRP